MWLFLVFAVCVITCSGTKIRESRNYPDDSRIPTSKGKNPHGTSRFSYTYVSVCLNGTQNDPLVVTYAKKCEKRESLVALGRYTNQVNTTGWGILEIETFSGHPYGLQSYAAGVAEGELTRRLISFHYRNTMEEMCKNHTYYCERLYKYLTKNLEWMRSEVLSKPPTDLFWRHVNLTFAQLTGLRDSYMRENLTPRIAFELSPIYMMQLHGDLFDLEKYLNKTSDSTDGGRCSALVKIAPGNKDLFFSHVTMSSFSWMIRLLKLYKFGFDPKEVPGHTVTFSGYPGQLASTDDFYLTSGGLAFLETTIDIFKTSLYNHINPEGQVLCWIRSTISNYLSSTPRKWVELFSRYNSGTYNNQWDVLDYKLFKPGKEIPEKDLFWILEQTPGYVKMEDMTWFLKNYSYWPSYNIPFFKDIGISTGVNEVGEEYDWCNWNWSPRARIFKRDHKKVVDIDTLTKLMRYNDYTHDEFSRCKCTPLPYTAEAAIAARGDLNDPNGTYEWKEMGFRDHAAFDFKGTNYEMFSKLRFRAWGGPTYDPLPVFDWSTTKVVANHFGQPQVWNFTYVDLEWETETEVLGFENVDRSV
ncbi:hypothetical protein RB195_011465 [Necator americanus]|uniref:Phospholipase B-like n=1 Tax=Necator americanus TaxID=51031 RepID=A0ABR1D3C4_NECAM